MGMVRSVVLDFAGLDREIYRDAGPIFGYEAFTVQDFKIPAAAVVPSLEKLPWDRLMLNHVLVSAGDPELDRIIAQVVRVTGSEAFHVGAHFGGTLWGFYLVPKRIETPLGIRNGASGHRFDLRCFDGADGSKATILPWASVDRALVSRMSREPLQAERLVLATTNYYLGWGAVIPLSQSHALAS